MAHVEHVELDWSHDNPQVNKAVVRALQHLRGRDTLRPRTVIYVTATRGRYALLLSGVEPDRFNRPIIETGDARFVVGVSEQGGPWRIGVADYGVPPGDYVDLRGNSQGNVHEWPMVLVPLKAGVALEGFIGRIAPVGRRDSPLIITRNSTEGIDHTGPTVLNGLEGVRSEDLPEINTAVVVNRPE